MNTYEMTLVLTEETGKDEAKAKKLALKLVTSVGGSVKDTKVMGLRDLAYPIKKAFKGWYGVFAVELPGKGISELEKLVKINEKILRYLLVKAEDSSKAK